MERTVTVRTPESVAFYYDLAGLGSRFLAMFVDLTLQMLFTFAWVLAVSMAVEPLSVALARLHLKTAAIVSVFSAALIMLIFLTFFGYFIIFETWWNGQTIGKRFLGIRVVRDGGYPLDFMAAAIRNLIRVIEFAFGYVPSAICALLSPQNKRLGDIVAGTIVVRDRAFEVTDPSRWLSVDQPLRPAQLDFSGLDADETALVRRFVERRTTMDSAARRAAAQRIAAPVRVKLGPSVAGLSDEELLVRIAATARR